MSTWWRLRPEYAGGFTRVFGRVDGPENLGCVPAAIINLDGGRLVRTPNGLPVMMLLSEATIAELSEIRTAICTQLDHSAQRLLKAG